MPHKFSLFKKHLRRLILTSGVLTPLESYAAIEQFLNEYKAIEAPISQHNLTRIAVKGDRILHIFGLAGEYALEADESQGQIFIRPQGHASKPIYLTLATEKGHTQDLRLLPQEKPPESIILKEKDDSPSSPHRAPIAREEVKNLIEACLEGRIPLGYKRIPIPLKTILSQGSQPRISLIQELRGERLRCLTYEIKNSEPSPYRISEEEFLKILSLPRLISLLIPKKNLLPQERTPVYAVTSLP